MARGMDQRKRTVFSGQIAQRLERKIAAIGR
jgi:hypothetical protein